MSIEMLDYQVVSMDKLGPWCKREDFWAGPTQNILNNIKTISTNYFFTFTGIVGRGDFTMHSC